MSANLNIYTKQTRLISDLNCLTASLGYFYVDRITIDHASVQNGSETGLLIVTNGGDVGAINKSNTSTGITPVFSTLDDHCRLPDSLIKTLLHCPITFKHSISQVREHH